MKIHHLCSDLHQWAHYTNHLADGLLVGGLIVPIIPAGGLIVDELVVPIISFGGSIISVIFTEILFGGTTAFPIKASSGGVVMFSIFIETSLGHHFLHSVGMELERPMVQSLPLLKTMLRVAQPKINSADCRGKGSYSGAILLVYFL